MRFSLKNRICAVFLCICTVFMSGCFPVHSILGSTTDYAISGGELDIDNFKMNNSNQRVSGIYPEGTRAFMFKECTYEADIDNFKLIGILGHTMVYFYTGIKVYGVDGENLKGYYDSSTVNCKHFWTIASYNTLKKEYTTIKSMTFNPQAAEKINGNPTALYEYSSTASYMVNVGYDFFLFSMSSDDSLNYYYNNDVTKWSMSNDNKKAIRKALDISGNTFCCSDMAVKNRDEMKFAVTFMALPDSGDDFNQDNVMFEFEFKTEQKKRQTVRSIKVRKKEKAVLTVAGGNIISSNPDSGNCIYVLSEGNNIKFGIDNRDRKTSFKISVKGQSSENKVLQSFSVEDWKDDKGNISDEESTLELVFKNRVEYYKIERYHAFFGVIEYRAKKVASYPLDSFNSNFLSSDDIPSIGYYSHGINLCSAEKGFKCIDKNGNIRWQRLKSGAAFFSAPYGSKTIVVGFNAFTFDKTVHVYDDNGKEVSVSRSESEFTLAQLPFATVRIY